MKRLALLALAALLATGSVKAEERLLPDPTTGEAPAGGDMAAAFSAYQRGFYLTAFRIAEPLAHMGDAAAQSLVAELLLRGQGVQLDVPGAVRWYRLSAEAGRPEAEFRYALMLLEGEDVELSLIHI